MKKLFSVLLGAAVSMVFAGMAFAGGAVTMKVPARDIDIVVYRVGDVSAHGQARLYDEYAAGHAGDLSGEEMADLAAENLNEDTAQKAGEYVSDSDGLVMLSLAEDGLYCAVMHDSTYEMLPVVFSVPMYETEGSDPVYTFFLETKAARQRKSSGRSAGGSSSSGGTSTGSEKGPAAETQTEETAAQEAPEENPQPETEFVAGVRFEYEGTEYVFDPDNIVYDEAGQPGLMLSGRYVSLKELRIIPQTGHDWRLVCLLIAAGCALFVTGSFLKRREQAG